MEQILEFCVEPKSLFDILQHLGLKNRENLMEVYINPMIGAGALALAMTEQSYEPQPDICGGEGGYRMSTK